MIIGISGKINSGKDTVGKIIQILKNSPHFTNEAVVGYLDRLIYTENNFIIKKFADALKDIVCLLIGCTREQLEDREFKEKSLGEEWTQYGYADGHNDHYRNGEWTKSMNAVFCDKERYEIEKRINWQTAYKREMTPRLLLQLLGTECGRNIIHPNVWVNALMSKYKPVSYYKGESVDNKDIYSVTEEDELKAEISPIYPNWIITDTRFPNEAKAIKDKNGIIIRVDRLICPNCNNTENFHIDTNLCNECGTYPSEHLSETALDNAEFDYIIDNNGTLLDLVDNIKIILQKENII